MRAATIIILIAMLIDSCVTEKNFVKYHDKSKQAEMNTARHCADWYPIKEKIVKGDPEYIKGKDIYHPGDTQMIYVDCDSILAAQEKTGIKTKYIKVPVPGRVDTIIKPEIRWQENTAYKTYLYDSLAKVEKQKGEAVADFKGARKTRNILWVVVGCVALFTAIRWYLKSQKII